MRLQYLKKFIVYCFLIIGNESFANNTNALKIEASN